MVVIRSESWNTGTAKWTKFLVLRSGAEADVGPERERAQGRKEQHQQQLMFSDGA